MDSSTVKITFPPGFSSVNYRIRIILPENIVDAKQNIPNQLVA